MGKVKHPLHEQLGNIIYDIGKTYKFDVIVDTDCRFKNYPGIDQRIPFYLSYRPARESAVSYVDIILLKNNKIKLVCEVEESGFNPTKIFGKFFSTAAAKVCKSNDYHELDLNSTFIQIISTDKFPKDSLKEKQGQLIENEINHSIKTLNSWICNYRLIYGGMTDFEKPGQVGYDEIERIIRYL